MTELIRSASPISVSEENASRADLFESYVPLRGAKDVRVSLTEEFLSSTNASAFFHGRLNRTDGRDVTLKFSTTGFIRNEYEGLSILHGNNLRVPEPIALVERGKKPRTGIIMGRVFGNDFSDVSSSENLFRLGEEVRRANEIAVPGFGLITNGIAQFQNAQEHMEAEVAIMMPHIQSDTASAQLLSELWGEVKEDVRAQEPRFTHRDLKGRNVMVSESGNVILLDLEYWNGGDPLWDAGGFLFYVIRSGKRLSEFEDFLRGYIDGQEPTDNQKLRILFYTLLSAGKFVELVARADPENIEYARSGLSRTSDFIRGKLKKSAF